jgi:hypothetical protein
MFSDFMTLATLIQSLMLWLEILVLGIYVSLLINAGGGIKCLNNK